MITMPTWWSSRGFLAGLALSAPIVAIQVPIRFTAVLVIPLIVDLLAFRKIGSIPRYVWPLFGVFGSLIALHILGIALDSTAFGYVVARDLVWVVLIVAISLLGASSDQASNTARGFFASVAIFTTILAALGVAKFMLQRSGIVFETLIDSCGLPYPQGTIVCGDYNLLALSMLVGAVALSAIVLNRQRPLDLMAFLLVVALALTLTAGFFSGSRRFAFAAMVVVLMWAMHAIFTGRFREVCKLAVLPLLLTTALYLGLNAPDEAVLDKDVTIIGLPEWNGQKLQPATNANKIVRENPSALAPRTVSTTALAGTIELGSRWDRWNYAFDLLATDGFMLGRLFSYHLSYHQKFSCRFTGCLSIDYPHSTVLSATLAFGVVGAVLAVLFYTLSAFNILLAGKAGWLSGVSPAVVAAIPYSLISGDTVFSIWPVVVVVALLNIVPKPLLTPAANWLRKQTAAQSDTQPLRP